MTRTFFAEFVLQKYITPRVGQRWPVRRSTTSTNPPMILLDRQGANRRMAAPAAHGRITMNQSPQVGLREVIGLTKKTTA